MKKTYISPDMEVVEIGVQQMLCGSIMSLDDNDLSVIDTIDPDDIITDENEIW